MGAFYFRPPTAADLEGTGLLPEHYPEPQETVHPENWEAWSLFLALQGQWRCGPGGPVALDRVVVFDELRHRGITGEDRDDVLDALSIIESEAIKELTKG